MRESCFGCPRTARVISSKELSTMSKNILKGIILGARPVYGRSTLLHWSSLGYTDDYCVRSSGGSRPWASFFTQNKGGGGWSLPQIRHWSKCGILIILKIQKKICFFIYFVFSLCVYRWNCSFSCPGCCTNLHFYHPRKAAFRILKESMVLLGLQRLTRLELKNGIKLDEGWIALLQFKALCLEHSSLTPHQKLNIKACERWIMDRGISLLKSITKSTPTVNCCYIDGIERADRIKVANAD